MLKNDKYIEIAKNQEKKYYKDMADDAEKDFDYVAQLSHNCCDAIFDNEISSYAKSYIDHRCFPILLIVNLSHSWNQG